MKEAVVRLFKGAAVIGGGALGAGLGVFARDFPIFTDQGWMGWALAFGAMSLLILGLAHCGVRWFTGGPHRRISTVSGPLLGALLGGIAWHYGTQMGVGIPAVVLDALHLPSGWSGYLIAGSLAGLLLAVYVQSEVPLVVGAA